MTHGWAWPDPRRLVLASTSPRRRALLREAGIEHDAIAPGIDDAELVPGVACGKRWAMSLAYLKARAGLEALRSARAAGDAPADRVVLGADTLCQLGDGATGELMIAPRDEDDARRMLCAMRSREHAVYTGLALVQAAGGGIERSEPARAMMVDCAMVRWGYISDEEIDRYIASGAWRGKAGAYNLAERVSEGWPIEVEGDPQGVMGLPIRRLAELSRALGGRCCAA